MHLTLVIGRCVLRTGMKCGLFSDPIISAESPSSLFSTLSSCLSSLLWLASHLIRWLVTMFVTMIFIYCQRKVEGFSSSLSPEFSALLWLNKTEGHAARSGAVAFSLEVVVREEWILSKNKDWSLTWVGCVKWVLEELLISSRLCMFFGVFSWWLCTFFFFWYKWFRVDISNFWSSPSHFHWLLWIHPSLSQMCCHNSHDNKSV